MGEGEGVRIWGGDGMKYHAYHITVERDEGCALASWTCSMRLNCPSEFSPDGVRKANHQACSSSSPVVGRYPSPFHLPTRMAACKCHW